MRLAPLLFILVFLVVIFTERLDNNKLQVECFSRRRVKGGKAVLNKDQRAEKRKLMIKCCGKSSCTNLNAKKKTAHPKKNTTTKTSGNFKTHRQKTPVTLADSKQSTQAFTTNAAVNKTETVLLDEISRDEHEEATNIIDASLSREIDTTAVPDQTSSTTVQNLATKSSTRDPLADEQLSSAIPNLTTSSVEVKTVSLSPTSSIAENETTSLPVSKATTPSNTSATISASLSTASKPISTSTSTSTATTKTTSTTMSTPYSTTTTTTVKSTTTSKTSTMTTKTVPTTPTKAYTTPTTKAAKILPNCPTLCQRDILALMDFGKQVVAVNCSFSARVWYIIRESQNSVYFILHDRKNIKVNWEQNIEKCCSLGMIPITMSSTKQSKCFNSLINGNKWKYNSRYWTSSLRSSGDSFKWCSSNAAVDPALWLEKEPSNTNGTENCAQLEISKSNSSASLNDKHCKLITAFACQGSTTPKPSCEAPVCPNITCAINKDFFTTMVDGETTYLTKPKSHGYMAEEGGRSFLFSFQNDTRTFEQSLLACCSIGMKLLSLQQNEKQHTIMKAMKTANQQPAKFWTSGTDSGCEGFFGFCTTNRLLRDETRWEMGQKDNLNQNEHCLAVNIQQSALFRDENCDLKLRYICEASLASGHKAVEVECGNAYNLTAEQIAHLLLKTPEDLGEKCFLKCYGEGIDMFKNGKLSEEKIYAQLTSVSAGDVEKLMEMFSTMNHCAGSTKGMDVCDKAAQLLNCGKENSPSLLTGVMKNLENAVVDTPVVLPPTKGVCPTFNCVVDDDMKIRFDSLANSSVIFENAYKAHVLHACNQKFLHAEMSSPVNFKDSAEFCCKFGLRLITLSTQNKLQCLQNNNFGGIIATHIGFIVAASRMGKVDNPVWCFSDTPFYPLPGQDDVSSDTNPNNHLLLINYASKRFFTYGGALIHVACENI